jgi:hypothetical protein
MSTEIHAGDWVQLRRTGQVGKVDEIREGWLWWGDDFASGKRWPIPVVQLLGQRRRTMVPGRDLIKLR